MSGQASIQDMNKMTTDHRAPVVRSLVKGNSIRATVRMTGAAKNTIVKSFFRNQGGLSRLPAGAPCQPSLQADSVRRDWELCGDEEKQIDPALRGRIDLGDIWTWTVLDANTKLVACFHTLTRDKRGIHTTPAMAAGISDHVWKIEEIVALIP